MKKAKWIILAITVLLAGFALFEIYALSNQIRRTEQEKVKLWANAISQKAQLVNYSEQFFASVARDEHLKMEMYTNILRSFDSKDMGADVDFSLDYVRYIVDSSETAIIITDKDSLITVPSELAGQKLEGELLQEALFKYGKVRSHFVRAIHGSEKTEGWRIERFSKVDLSIIRLALYEMYYDDETPEKVAVNEAVELAKVYGGDESPKFINGVLARLIRKDL